MATAEASADAGDQSANETEQLDPRLDFFSDKFDPLLALNTPNIRIPCPEAKVYDNIAMYQSARARELKEQQNSGTQRVVKKEEVAGCSKVIERRWLPHQLPIKTNRKHEVKNVFTKMEKMRGPLQILTKCVNEHLKIKIWIRHSHGIRGYCTAYVVVYDKFWNLALEDVTEIWDRPRKCKVPALDSTNQPTKQLISKHSKLVKIPEIEIIARTKNVETCKRHINQLMVRGEQIALIAILDENDNK